MIHLTYSNRTEALLGALLERLDARRARGEDPLAPVWLVVPNKNIERYVELGVARGLGIAANLRFERLSSLVTRWLGAQLLMGDALTARVLSGLCDDALLATPPMAPVRRYLGGAGDDPDAVDLRRAQLAMHVARLFEEYGFSRAELLDAWTHGQRRFRATAHARTEAWQASLFQHARAHEKSAGWQTLREALAAAPPPPFDEVHVFGLSYVARAFSEIFDVLGQHASLHLYSLNPCEEFWEDVETEGELRRRHRRDATEPTWVFDDEEDPFRLSVETETPLLRRFGRPGREHVRLLDALTECDFDARFLDPLRDAATEPPPSDALPLFSTLAAPTLLERLQHDVLARTPRHEAPSGVLRDDSITVLRCPSVRREVETVAMEIWRAVSAIDDLSFDQIAVLVNGPDRDLYLPHIAAVFEEARAIPYNVVDLSLASVSPLVEASLRLLALPASRFTRPDVLGVITHPAVRPPDVEPDAWVALVERLGIFHGIDQRAHRDTYAERGDHLSWDQGLTRVALGAFVPSDVGFVSIDGVPYLPEESGLSDRDAARFALLVRSLASDVRFARTAELSLTQWAALFGAMLSAYLRPSDAREESALRRALAAVASLAELDLDGRPVRHPIAHELAKSALEALSGSRGQHLADGVAVASLMPMRAIPFRVIFVLGLGEGRFPAADRRDSLDLRAARRRAGDVTPPERDRYTFLETLLCARDRLVLSYVARDEHTGDPLAPSAVVAELLEVIEGGYLGDVDNRVVRRPRLSRHEEDELARYLPAAAAERAAARIGDALRTSLAKEGREGVLARASVGETARRAAGSGPLRDALGLAPLPERRAAPREATESVVRLRLSALRRFVECPLQGWTQIVLRLEEDDFESAAALADEPFAASGLDATMTLRGAFEEAALTGAPIEERYAARVRQLEARGRWPLGALARIEAERHAEVLARWRAGWDTLGEPTARGRASFGGARVEGGDDLASLSVAAADPARLDAVHDPIVLRFDDDPRYPGSGRALRVEITGRTELLRASPRASVTALVRRKAGALGRVEALRYGLRAFFDHVALAASDRPGPHHSAQLYGDHDDVAPLVLPFAPIAPEAARAWLRALVADLLGGPHAYLLPVEAVLRLEDRFDEARGEDIVRSVEHVRDQWGGGQSRYGPVREPLRYAPPAPGVAEEIVERRFGLVLRSLGRSS